MAFYVGQSNVEITLDTGIDLATATAPAIFYTKPSGETGEWAGTISGSLITFALTDATPFDEAGMWLVQAKCMFGTLTAYGSVTAFRVLPSLG